MKAFAKLTGILLTALLLCTIISAGVFPVSIAQENRTAGAESMGSMENTDTTIAFAGGASALSAPVGVTPVGNVNDDMIKESIILYVGSPLAYVNGVEKRIDPGNLEVAPVIIDNKVMVPVRFIAESLGGSVQWEGDSKTVSIVFGRNSYRLTHGNDTMVSGSVKYSLGVKVQAYKGRTIAPMERFAEISGKKAFYEKGLIIISNSKIAIDREKDKQLIDEWISKLSYLPVLGTREKLLGLLEDAAKNEGYRYGRALRNGVLQIDEGERQSIASDSAVVSEKSQFSAASSSDSPISGAAGSNSSVQGTAVSSSASPASGKPAASPAGTSNDSNVSETGDYSATNVQVQGVDEGDIVKTDGNYIYQVNKQRIAIVKAVPAENMRLESIINYADRELIPLEIYLHGNKMAVIGTSRAYFPLYREDNGVKKEIYPSRRFMSESTKVLIYNIADKANAKLIREIEIQGRYVSSRKMGSALYLVANDRVDYYSVLNGDANATPTYRDTAVKGGIVNLGYDSIRFFPGSVEPNYMTAAGVDLDGNEAANISAYLGSGENIYASAENLYVAVADYQKAENKNSAKENTRIYKFAMNAAKLTYLCSGTVPGTILNQFSMDENGNMFRIATTKGNTWAIDESISKNALYVLDSMLSIIGKIEDIAPGEKIYSVRFMGDRAYLVTFKTVDPLFVIDLKDPAKPAVLGTLKIPGYSDYLHMYDENHIIGFGKDTVEIKGQAYYLGMKIALFDVTDVARPVQKFSVTIGDRGTDSELLSNHKALLFSKEKNLLVFPVTLMEKDGKNDIAGDDALRYGRFAFQGALVYSLDLQNGFKLRGKITHLSEEDYLKAGDGWYHSDKDVQRIIYIGSNLYTLSNSMIKANAMSDLKEIGRVAIP